MRRNLGIFGNAGKGPGEAPTTLVKIEKPEEIRWEVDSPRTSRESWEKDSQGTEDTIEERFGWEEPPPLPIVVKKAVEEYETAVAEYRRVAAGRAHSRSRSPIARMRDEDKERYSPQIRTNSYFPFSDVKEASCYALGRKITDINNKFAMFANVSIKPNLRTYIFNEVVPDYDTEDFQYTGQSFVAFSRCFNDGWNIKVDANFHRGCIFEVQTKPNWNENYDSVITRIRPLLNAWRRR